MAKLQGMEKEEKFVLEVEGTDRGGQRGEPTMGQDVSTSLGEGTVRQPCG